MDDTHQLRPPVILADLETGTRAVGFKLASDPLTGALLRTLAASKPGGRLLEIGTGTGMGTAWLLAGMDAGATLLSIENDARFLDVARRCLGDDSRVTFRQADAACVLAELPKSSFDLIFADTWAGKYTHLEEALSLLAPGGLYVVDDMLPQSTWPEGHAEKAARLVAELDAREDLVVTKMCWATGIILAVKRGV
ncbi:MAG: methyltransferase domain-containing protein [Planctomycetota bacterium]|nr:MAG: methyltransferase domain-containing protein [Planctomycetota bacterium]